MLSIRARNVNEAWALFHQYVADDALVREVAPRGMRTREFLEPVCTTYYRPQENVLLDPVRDANPFFHLYEALYLLCGFNDVGRLAWYNPRMREFSDDGVTFNAAYGARMMGSFVYPNQLKNAVEILRKDPDSRRAVVDLHDPADLVRQTKDQACNTTLYLKIRDGALNLTVCNRSNDAVWGCYGANAVQFSVLLQLGAAMLGVSVGVYRQISDSLHVYLEGPAGKVWQRCASCPPMLVQDYSPSVEGAYAPSLVRVSANVFMNEVTQLLSPSDGTPNLSYAITEPFLANARVMLLAFALYRHDQITKALDLLVSQADATVVNDEDNLWLCAGMRWLHRRSEHREPHHGRPS